MMASQPSSHGHRCQLEDPQQQRFQPDAASDAGASSMTKLPTAAGRDTAGVPSHHQRGADGGLDGIWLVVVGGRAPGAALRHKHQPVVQKCNAKHMACMSGLTTTAQHWERLPDLATTSKAGRLPGLRPVEVEERLQHLNCFRFARLPCLACTCRRQLVETWQQ